MRKRRKPRILPFKIKLANELRARWPEAIFSKHPQGYFWWATFHVPGIESFTVYFQLYSRTRLIDYVKFNWSNTGRYLTITELRDVDQNLKAS